MKIETSPSSSAPMPDLPVLGYRNYWYPIMESRRVGRRPVSVRVLGEDIVLFPGKGGKVAALVDRCPHRGTMLSRGRILFPGTLSCGYHGWTFNEQGECVAAIVEGPESRLPGNVSVRAYPTEERFGILWAFIGEGEPPPLEEDLPPELKEQGILTQFAFSEWACNWRNITENYPDILHAPFVHRSAFEVIFNKVPAWGNCWVELLPDGKGVHVHGTGGGLQAEYPGLGKYPAHLWWRVLRRRYKLSEAPTAGGNVRMPGHIVVKIRDPYFGVHISNLGWPVPIDDHRSRHLNLIVTYPKTSIHKLAQKAWYKLYYRNVHRLFLKLDRFQVEVQNYRDPETLSNTDIGLIQWRRLAAQIARQPQSYKSVSTEVSSSKHEDKASEEQSEELTNINLRS